MTELSSQKLEISSLLEYSNWVRSVARGLVAHEADQEDAIQDTWVTALAHPPREGGSIKTWLSMVVRSRLFSQHRSQTRRRQREQRVAEGDLVAERRTPPTPDELVLQASMSQEIGDAVAQLDPRYRSVVLLRFFHGMSNKAIAQELGLKEGTVRQQLRRALDKLRDRLQGRFGDGWMSVCVLLANTKPPVGLIGSSGGPGGLSLKQSAVAASVLVGGVLLADPLLDAEPVHADPRSEAPVAFTSGHGPAPGPSLDPVARRRELPPPASHGQSVFGGRVVYRGEDGHGVAGALVQLGSGQVYASDHSDADGRFLIEWDGPLEDLGRPGAWLQAGLDGYAARVERDLLHDGSRDFLLVLTDEGLEIAARAEDGSGRGVPGVPLELLVGDYRSRSVTDENGIARLRAPETGDARLQVDTRSEHLFGPSARELRVGPATSGAPVPLRVERYPERLHLLALAADRPGKVLGDASFRLRPASGAEQQASDWEPLRAAGGLLDHRHPPDRGIARVAVEAAGYSPQVVVPDRYDPAAPIPVLLEPLRRVALRVQRGGRPVEQPVTVRWSAVVEDHVAPYRSGYPVGDQVATDDSGRARLALPSPLKSLDALELEVKDEQGSWHGFGRVLPGTLPENEPWILELEPERVHVKFVLRDARGAPLRTRILTSLEPEIQPNRVLARRDARLERALRTDEEGVAEHEFLAPARLFWSTADGRSWTDLSLEAGSDPVIEVQVEPHGLPLSGMVDSGAVDFSDVHPPSRWVVLIDPASGEEVDAVIPADDGSFTFEDVPGGSYALRFRHADAASALTVDSGTSGHLLPLPPLHDVSLRAVDEYQKQPLRGAVWIGITDQGVRLEGRARHGVLEERNSLHGYRILAMTKPGYAPALHVVGSRDAGKDVPTLTLGAGRTLQGRPGADLMPDRPIETWRWMPVGETAVLSIDAKPDGSFLWEDAPHSQVTLHAYDAIDQPLGLEARCPADSVAVVFQAAADGQGGE